MHVTAPARAIEWMWPANVLAFADEHQLTAYLEPVLEMTRQLFPGRVREAVLEADWEIPERYITIDVDITGLDVGQIGATRNRWLTELCRVCPANQIFLFHIGLVGG
jgi:hypothetical protein